MCVYLHYLVHIHTYMYLHVAFYVHTYVHAQGWVHAYPMNSDEDELILSLRLRWAYVLLLVISGQRRVGSR